ncbi:MAG: 3-methyl-2-oxobutanoate hydroxymethyltransferase [Candidatus Fervidibacter sp.]|uniref:3-methyl-2-oxobutanoate hydroxymethyltransferase n=1 Tax=Candidatus Fervidibacter sp. TaxID=3100871 RepID=UPI004049C3CD
MDQPKRKVRVQTLLEKKQAGEKIVAVTAYDYPTALLVDEAGVDMVLVGDSVGNVVLGYESTLPVTMEEMRHHVRAVKRGIRTALLVADMPFLSYQSSVAQAIENAGLFIKDGAEAVKLEGGTPPIVQIVRALVDVGIPVVGHLGFTPQWIHQFGGARVRGRRSDEAKRLADMAYALQDAGCFAIVLELVPEEVAAIITERLNIPTIGIGAGAHCDGQILVLHDLIGMLPGWTPRHAKRYAEVGELIRHAVATYAQEVREGKFPTAEHATKMAPEELERLKQLLQPE